MHLIIFCFQPKSKSNNGFQSQRSVTTVPAEVQDNMFDNDIFGDSSDLETFGQGSRVDGGNDTDSEEERGLIIDTNIHESTEDEVLILQMNFKVAPAQGQPSQEHTFRILLKFMHHDYFFEKQTPC